MARLELLYWEGCPSHPAALEDLRAALLELGHGQLAVDRVRVDSDDQAAREGFVGSPTIRIDGADVFPPPPGSPTGLTCRVYRLSDGRFSPTPDPQELRRALSARLRPAS